MIIPVGLALGALSGVSSLIESAASGLAKAGGNDPLSALAQAFTGDQPPADPAGKPAGGPFNSGTLATLISLQGQNGAGGASGLFAKLDANSDGSISKSEFESALAGAGVDSNSADAVFGRLDADGDGSISKSELASARGGYHSHHHGHHVGGASGGGAASLLNATSADGSQTQTTSNPDGSTTTTVTYADGSTVSTTTPASGGSGTPNRGNLLEQLVKLQAQLTSPANGTTAAVA
jgi:hypothetical protein